MNERDNNADSTTTESLTDLAVSPEQAEETKAGALGSGGGVGMGKCSVHDIS